VQGRSWVLDSDCAARGGLGFWVLVAWREEVLGSGFWLRDARRSWVLDSGCTVQGGFGFLAARRGKVMLGLAVWCEEGSGCGGAHSLYIRVRCCLSYMFLLHATTCFLREKLLRLAEGKDGSPMGVVRRGGVHIVCSTEAQWN